MMIWIKFFISTGVIVFAGVKLTRYADAFSERHGLGKAWVGVLLLGLVTSLPELFTSLWSVVYLQAYDLAVGNVLGSNNFNPMILILLDFFCREKPVSSVIHYPRAHVWSARMILVMSLVVALDLFFKGFIDAHIGGMSVMMLLLTGCYFWGMHGVYKRDVAEQKPISGLESHKTAPIVEKLHLKLLVAIFFVTIGAVYLTDACDQIAVVTGLGRSFIGTLVLAFVTSLPEIVVSYSALRLGSFDMAIGNVFGSNMTNLFIIAICSFMTSAKPLLWVVSPEHAIALLSSILLLIMALDAVKHPRRVLWGMISWISIMMMVVFISAAITLYYFKS